MKVFYVVVFSFGIILNFHYSECRVSFSEYESFLKSQANNHTFVELFNKHVQLFQSEGKLLELPPFPCEAQTRAGPATVHTLTPSDIRVVAALGDSLTAGLGIKANTILGLLREDRGLSWSIGGDDDVTEHVTLANIIKEYNSEVKGFSVGFGDQYSKDAHLNVADSGAVSVDMIGQAERLVELMKKEPGVDFDNDWKIITLFVGGNDLCDFCDEELKYSVENYKANLQQTLDILHKSIPKAFVNLVEVLNIADINVLNEGLICDTLHFFTCRCGAFPTNAERDAMRAAVTQYQKAARELADSGRYDTRDDFTVVAQPFYEGTLIPRLADGGPDRSFFAPDCFHLSAKGHKAAAEALWNNMIEAVGEKRTKWTPDQPVECPTAEQPYFYTRKNSRQGFLGAVNDVSDDKSEEKSDDTSAHVHKSGEVAAIFGTVGLIAGVIVLAVVVTVIRNKRSAERKKLLGEPIKMSYTQI